MSIITSQQLSRYFEQFRSTEVTFNRQVIEETGLITSNVYLKILDQQWPCIIYSSSMAGAKVIASVRSAFFDALKKANNHLALRCCFKQPEKTEAIAFFVPGHATAFMQYNPQNPDVQLVSIDYTQRPPEDLIQILGTLLEININSKRRKEERITLTPEITRRLGLETRDATLSAERVSHRCILRDLSFSGAKVLASGAADSLAQKKIALRISKYDQKEQILLNGEVVRTEGVEGRQDILVIGIRYTGELPMSYKLMINAYISSARKAPISSQGFSPNG